MTVGIVGLGLIGGSMAKSIKARTAHTVFGCDLDQETMMMARMCGAIDAPLTAENLKDCDLVLVAIRPAAAVKWVKEHAEGIRRGAILVDLCGVKRAVVRELAPVAEQYGFAYIGGHPMAGSEQSGYTSAHADLLCGAKYVITPSAHTSKEHLDAYVELVKDIKAVPIVMDPATHDYCAAAISHVPHLVSAALAKLVKDADTGDYKDYMHLLAAGGFKDTTRIAASSPEMWEQICAANPTAISQLLGEYINSLTAVKEHIDSGDSHYIYKLFEEAGIYRNTFFGPDRS